MSERNPPRLPFFPSSSSISTTDGDTLNIKLSEESTSSYTLTFPAINSLGFLKNDGNGELTWEVAEGSGGSNSLYSYNIVDLTSATNFTLNNSYEVVLFNDSDSGTKNVFLPLLSSISSDKSKFFILVKNTNNTINIKPQSGEFIDINSQNVELNGARGDRVKIFSTSISWFTM